ncbi:MAG: hypothetical protein WD399_00360 [Thermoleophilaceae bacterium]
MPDGRRYEIDELLVRPGTYFNPQTEVLVVVDDSSSIDSEIFAMEEFEGADWVLVSDDLPVDEPKRDELLETFQATYHGGDGRQPQALENPEEDDDVAPDEEPERPHVDQPD